MINAGKLLADLKRLRRVLDADVRETHASGAKRDSVQVEWQEAFDLGRTRDSFEVFLDGALDQAVVHWVLGCVFLRFLEDNLLVDRPFLSGPGERLDLAKERQEAHFRARLHDSDTEYLLATFGEAARLPGMAGLFDPAHNPLFRLPVRRRRNGVDPLLSRSAAGHRQSGARLHRSGVEDTLSGRSVSGSLGRSP